MTSTFMTCVCSLENRVISTTANIKIFIVHLFSQKLHNHEVWLHNFALNRFQAIRNSERYKWIIINLITLIKSQKRCRHTEKERKRTVTLHPRIQHVAAKSPDLKSKFLFMYLNNPSLPVPLYCTQTLKKDVLNRATMKSVRCFGCITQTEKPVHYFITN